MCLAATCSPEKYTIKPERKEIAAVSIDLTRHDDFQGPRKLEVSEACWTWLGKLDRVAILEEPVFMVTRPRASMIRKTPDEAHHSVARVHCITPSLQPVLLRGQEFFHALPCSTSRLQGVDG